MWRSTTQSRTWGWSSDAREKADQARREDSEYWSGPTYYHGAHERNIWGEEWDPEQEDRHSSKHQERQRKARKEARREAERKKRDIDTPPARDPVDRDPVDQDPEAATAETTKRNEEQETREKVEKDERYNGSWTKTPSPQQPDPNSSERVKEKKERKEQSARKKAERELSRRDWPAELLLLFSKIITLQINIEEIRVNADALRRAMKVLVFPKAFPSYLRMVRHVLALCRFQDMVL